MEEDPFTDRWTRVGDWRIVACRSRFEVDLNRSRDKAVYLEPEDAWGLRVWNATPGDRMLRRSLQAYDAFYDMLARLLRRLEGEYGRFLVLDLHSYNHRRAGPEAPPADPEANPEINIGTGSMDRRRWADERTRFMSALGSVELDGRRLDVRENVRFQGGHLASWVHASFPTTGCVFAVEVKKFFMDEWTGRLDPVAFGKVESALRRGASACREAWQTA
jgi:N-formylglutamate amidohydrolase